MFNTTTGHPDAQVVIHMVIGHKSAIPTDSRRPRGRKEGGVWTCTKMGGTLNSNEDEDLGLKEDRVSKVAMRRRLRRQHRVEGYTS